ncbi:hypothetical protein JCM19231_4125 [Vibrio ishigakensis]|uniref:Uncharacterized protein n=1 Tax=Vibrio ishigakensis TaxID=1481914 RepID=A0A0B8NTJ7_9VIBR|nr:hypothetical protein [Vibrio ishigakensis]GAM57860.1 hypothetical protein JCM19231_4125 [Vibrio ishigakensis]
MFIVISASLCALLVVTLLVRHGQQVRQSDRKYQLICELRNLIELLREHRTLAHTHLCVCDIPPSQCNELKHRIVDTISALLSNAEMSKRPMLRLLRKQVRILLGNWPEMTPSRSQMSHSKSIRVCLYLIDEMTLSWLIESEKYDLSERYSAQWNHIIDSLDALTRFQIAFADYLDDNPKALDRVTLKARLLQRKLNQLGLIAPLTVSAPSSATAMRWLDEVVDSNGGLQRLTQQEVMNECEALSLVIFRVYDHMLLDVGEELSHPLPELSSLH